jgi:hypothetical protein
MNGRILVNLISIWRVYQIKITLHWNFQNFDLYSIYLTFDFTLKSMGRAHIIQISLKSITFSKNIFVESCIHFLFIKISIKDGVWSTLLYSKFSFFHRMCIKICLIKKYEESIRSITKFNHTLHKCSYTKYLLFISKYLSMTIHYDVAIEYFRKKILHIYPQFVPNLIRISCPF